MDGASTVLSVGVHVVSLHGITRITHLTVFKTLDETDFFCINNALFLSYRNLEEGMIYHNIGWLLLANATFESGNNYNPWLVHY